MNLCPACRKPVDGDVCMGPHPGYQWHKPPRYINRYSGEALTHERYEPGTQLPTLPMSRRDFRRLTAAAEQLQQRRPSWVAWEFYGIRRVA